jgi:signal transduction histidine kinase
VWVTLAYLAISWGGQLILMTTPYELHQTVTTEVRIGSLVSDLLWLAAILTLMVRQPTSRLWILILVWLAVGQLWLLGYLAVEPRQLIDLPQAVGGELWAAVFVHLVVAYPSGRVTGTFDRALVVTTYAVAVGFRLLAMVIGPDPCYPMCDSPIRFFPNEALYDVFRYLGIAAALGLLVASLAVLARHWREAGPASRRVLWPMLIAAPIWCVSIFAGYFADAFLDEAARDATHSFSPIGVLMDNILPVAIIIGAFQATLARGNVAQLAVELGRGVPVGGLRPILARTLRDPSLELAFPAPDGSGLVDEAGRPVPEPDPARRAITRVEQHGELLAVIIDDPQAVADDPALVEAVGSVARLSLANERLAAQVRAQLEEVRASRARIVEAADAERRRVERDLHDGAQQRLTALAVRMDVARETGTLSPELLAEATSELRSAIGEVRDLSRGLHPTILTEAGLGAAIEALAERTPIPVRVSAPATRFPAAVEAAAYFVVAEGLTNVARYSGASAAEVDVSVDGGRLVVVVRDDGRGGADPARGSGLRGLGDRVAALDGRLSVDSAAGRGTVLRAELPIEAPPDAPMPVEPTTGTSAPARPADLPNPA